MATRGEKRAYDRLAKAVPGAHWERIESTVSNGVPDVNCCVKGHEVWFELKEPEVSKRTGLVTFRFRTSQTAWIKKRLHAGGQVAVAFVLDNELRLVCNYDIERLTVGKARIFANDADRSYFRVTWSRPELEKMMLGDIPLEWIYRKGRLS